MGCSLCASWFSVSGKFVNRPSAIIWFLTPTRGASLWAWRRSGLFGLRWIGADTLRYNRIPVVHIPPMPPLFQPGSTPPRARATSPRAPMVRLLHGTRGHQGAMPRLREAAKLVWRAAARRHGAVLWLAFLNRSEWLRELVERQPRLIKKMFRPYLSLRLDHRARLALLISHHEELERLGWQSLVLHAARADVPLSSWQGKSGQAYRLDLSAVRDMEREGELVLQLRLGGRRVAALAFSWWRPEPQGALMMAVGCLQGATGPDARELIRATTRDLFGLRPKSLLLRMAQQIGWHCGAAKLLLTSTAHHVLWRQRANGALRADYDAFWTEHGALPRSDGDFELLCSPLVAPDLSALPSAKRSEARKRAALLEAIFTEVWAALEHGGRPTLLRAVEERQLAASSAALLADYVRLRA